MYCFVAYVAMRANNQGVRDMLAYARLVIREAQRHGGSGWLDYDRVFRQQAALDPSLRWNTLHPGIQASTLVGRVAGSALLCTFCREPDHSAGQCALSYLQSPLVSVHSAGPPGPRAPFRRRPESLAGICVSGTRGGAASRVRAGSDIFVLHATSLIWPEIVGRLPRGRSTRP